MDNSRLEKVISPYKIEQQDNETHTDILTRDLIAITDLLHYVDAEPFIAPEKADNIKRIAFKKIIGG